VNFIFHHIDIDFDQNEKKFEGLGVCLCMRRVCVCKLKGETPRNSKLDSKSSSGIRIRKGITCVLSVYDSFGKERNSNKVFIYVGLLSVGEDPRLEGLYFDRRGFPYYVRLWPRDEHVGPVRFAARVQRATFISFLQSQETPNA
jgi:hypothetical protein